METKALELLEVLGLTHFTNRHLQLAVDFLSSDDKVRMGVNNQSACEDFLTSLGSWDMSDLQKTQSFVEVNFC